jgi:hypothetical protein
VRGRGQHGPSQPGLSAIDLRVGGGRIAGRGGGRVSLKTFTILLLPLPCRRIDGETGQPCWSGGEQSWAQSAMDRWINADNIDRYY